MANPSGLCFDYEGALYIADQANHRIRRVDPNGVMTTVVGIGHWGYSGDGGPAIVEGNGSLSILSGESTGGMIGTRLTSHYPGMVVIQANVPGALPVLAQVDVSAIRVHSGGHYSV